MLSWVMDDAEYKRRQGLSFSQAEGHEPLPSQLHLGELPASVRAELWAVFHSQIKRNITNFQYELNVPFLRVVERHWVRVEHRMIDEFDGRPDKVEAHWKAYFHEVTKYDVCLGFVQWMLRAFQSPSLSQAVSNVLVRTRAAYRVVSGDTIMPVASAEEAAAMVNAIRTTDTAQMPAARQHLLDAAAELSSGNYANSVRESMSAVESVALASTGETNFAKAVGVMDGRRPMNGAFKIAVNRLYDYTSQEPGIRHAKKEAAVADVEEREAIFMLGVCASFVTYVLAE
ncbi:hypothetical protein [Pararhizobium sp. DWP1-1-3]|uniref:hypothetical protein n=1 Tax=Pararhizobium sp. DWP1-1-3 TaxID=2804652 RepID=UPI003CF2D585